MHDCFGIKIAVFFLQETFNSVLLNVDIQGFS
jgi:hypothetical protein